MDGHLRQTAHKDFRVHSHQMIFTSASNQALERTADRREKKGEMLSRLAVEIQICAPVSGRSSYSR